MGLYPPSASPMVECHQRGQLQTVVNLLETSLCVKVISSRIVCQSLLSGIKGAEHDSVTVNLSVYLKSYSGCQLHHMLCRLVNSFVL